MSGLEVMIDFFIEKLKPKQSRICPVRRDLRRDKLSLSEENGLCKVPLFSSRKNSRKGEFFKSGLNISNLIFSTDMTVINETSKFLTGHLWW